VVDPRRDVQEYLDHPVTAFIGHPEVTGTASRLTARQLAAAQAAVPGLVLLDVRGPGEYSQGSIEGSVHIPLGRRPDPDYLGLLAASVRGAGHVGDDHREGRDRHRHPRDDDCRER